MLIISISMGFTLITLSLLMFTVARVRPERFMVKFKLTNWISFEVEMRVPRLVPGTRGRRPRRRGGYKPRAMP
jgi:hypothetical protein